MAQAIRPAAVRNIEQISEIERQRYTVILNETNRIIQIDQQIPGEFRQHVLEANATAIHNLALERAFYSEEAARAAEINVQINPRIITQRPDTLANVVKKGVIQSIFEYIGWELASVNPLLGIGAFAVGNIVNSEVYEQKINNLYGN